VTFIAFILLGAIPLFGFLIPGLEGGEAFAASCVMTGITLFAIGAVRSLVGKKKWIIAGLEMLMVGAMAAVVAYIIGDMLHDVIGNINL